MPPVDAFSPVYQQFAAVTGTWYGTLFDYANQLFLMLATIEIGLGAIQWMVAQQSHDYVAMGLFRKILWIGFMYAVLLNAQTWIPAVISSFVQAGREASGIRGLNPAEIFIEGLGLTGSLLATLSSLVFFWKAPAIAASLFAAVVVFFSFCFIAIQMALALVEAYIVTGGGVFLLGFGAFHGTAQISERYLSYVIGVGIKLFVISLIVGAGANLTDQWIALVHNADLMGVVETPLAIAGSTLLYGLLAWNIPSLAASMASGAVGFGIQEAVGSTMMASKVALQSVATPMALGSAMRAARGIGKQTAQQAGGGVGGAIRGLSTAAGSLTREARNAAVPTLGRAVQNLQKQRSEMEGDQ